MRESFRSQAFKVWDYSVSHRQLLLRSAAEDSGSNVDLIFTDVSYVQLGTRLEDLVVRSATSSELRTLASRVGHVVDPSEAFVLEATGVPPGFVVAANVVVEKNDLDLFE